MILSLEPWRVELLEEALKHDIIFADDINMDINHMQFPKRTNKLMFSCFTCSKVFQVRNMWKKIFSLVPLKKDSPEHGHLYIWTELLPNFFLWSAHMRRELGTQITPRGWIFWTIIFYHQKIQVKIYLMRGQTLFWDH